MDSDHLYDMFHLTDTSEFNVLILQDRCGGETDAMSRIGITFLVETSKILLEAEHQADA